MKRTRLGSLRALRLLLAASIIAPPISLGIGGSALLDATWTSAWEQLDWRSTVAAAISRASASHPSSSAITAAWVASSGLERRLPSVASSRNEIASAGWSTSSSRAASAHACSRNRL
jgi:hypothetical protein